MLKYICFIFFSILSMAAVSGIPQPSPAPKKSSQLKVVTCNANKYIELASNVLILEDLYSGYITIEEFRVMVVEFAQLTLNSRAPSGIYYFNSRENLQDMIEYSIRLMTETEPRSLDDLRSLAHLFFQIDQLIDSAPMAASLAQEIFRQIRGSLSHQLIVNYSHMLVNQANAQLTPSSTTALASERTALAEKNIPITPYTILFFRTLLIAHFDRDTAIGLTLLAWNNHEGRLPIHQGILLATMIRDRYNQPIDYLDVEIAIAWTRMIRGNMNPQQIINTLRQNNRPQRSSVASAQAARSS